MILRLHQRGGTHSGRTSVFEQGPVRVGRLPESDLLLDAYGDLDVSGRHAELVQEDGAWWVVDCVSRNGTHVNGVRIGRHKLQDGDRIQLGTRGPIFAVELSEPANVAVAPTLPSTPERSRWAPPTGPAQPSPADEVPPPVDPEPPVSAPSMSEPLPTFQASRPSALAPVPAPSAPPPAPAEQAPAEPSPLRRRLKAVLAVAIAMNVLAAAALAAGVYRRSVVPDAGAVALANGAALVELVARNQGAFGSFCSGVAVDDRIIATSAGCVRAIEERQRAGIFVEIRTSEGVMSVSRLWRHPGAAEGSPMDDVGLIETDRAVPLVANLGGDPSEGEALVALERAPHGVQTTPLRVRSRSGSSFQHGANVAGGAPLMDRAGNVAAIAGGIGVVRLATDARSVQALLAGL